MITGEIFLDLTEYDATNYKLLVNKLYNATVQIITDLILSFLSTRRSFVEFQGVCSRLRLQKKLPEDSELAPNLVNIYTNSQPLTRGTKTSFYTDDLTQVIQARDFVDFEYKLTTDLTELDHLIDLRPKCAPSA